MTVEPRENQDNMDVSTENVNLTQAETEKKLVKDDKKMKYLVADTAAFIKNVQMHNYAQNIVSIHDVVAEIRDKETRQRLLAYPIEIQYKEPDSASLKKVIDFSKKSGDYGALSATDIKVIALTYMLEAATVGTAHLKEIPTIKRTTEFYNPKPEAKPQDTVSTAVPGFYMPSDESEEESEDEIEYEEAEVEIDNDQNRSNDQDPKDQNASLDDLANTLENSEFVEMSSNEVGNLEQEQEGIDTWESSEENEDEGWITPGNYVKKKEQMATINEKELAREVEVACMTSDFAMQNVLLSMGLNVASPSGQVIRETKTWILRCYACFKTTPHIEKKFCPKCGNKTLKRVSVTLNADGTQQIHISTRRNLHKTGKKFSLPKPEGGKYAINPILCEDQQFAQQRTTRIARAKNNPMAPDYICGNGPFTKNDVTSRSAMMGVGKATNQYWLHKNPNAVGRNTGNRKKKKTR